MRTLLSEMGYAIWLRYFLVLLLLVVAVISLPLRAGTLYMHSCTNEVNRWSYELEDEVCYSYALSTGGVSVGYIKTPSMTLDSYGGFFNPEINIMLSAFFNFDVFNASLCSYSSNATVNFNAIGAKDDGNFTEHTFLANRICVRTEEITNTPWPTWMYDSNCINTAADKADFYARKGRFGPRFPGERAICLYASTLGTTLTCDQIAPYRDTDRWPTFFSNFQGGRLTPKVKCIRIPPAPPPPPFCPIIMGRAQVRAVYLKPTNNTTNSFFSPGIRLVMQNSHALCPDGSRVSVGVTCADGSRGTLQTSTNTAVVVADLSKGGANNNITNQMQRATIGGLQYYVYFTTTTDQLCVQGSYDAMNRTDLGCFPRTMPPNIRYKSASQPGDGLHLNVVGNLSSNPSTAADGANGFGLNVTFDNYTGSSLPQLPPLSVQDVADSYNTGNFAALTTKQASFYGMNLSSARIEFRANSQVSANIIPKMICIKQDGSYASFTAGQTCDQVALPPQLSAFNCSGTIVLDAKSCASNAVPATVKRCSCKASVCQYVLASQDCPSASYILYDDDVSGNQLCLQGLAYEAEEFFLLQPDGSRVYVTHNARVLMPVDVSSGSPIFDFSKAPIGLSTPTQDAYDTMVYSPGGYFTMTIGGVKGHYIFARKTYQTAKGTTEFTSNGAPYYMTSAQQNLLIPSDPVRRDLCEDIDLTNMPIYHPFDVIYIDPGMYSSHVISASQATQVTNGRISKYFDAGVYSTDFRNYSWYPDASLQPSSFFYYCPNTAGCGWSGSNADLYSYPAGYSANRTDGAGNQYLLSSKILSFNHYFYDNTINPNYCPTLEFELWGAGAGSRVDGYNLVPINARTYYSPSDPGACANTGGHGFPGESGGYVHGAINLRRGSRIFVLVGDSPAPGGGPSSSPPTSLWVYDDVSRKPYRLVAYAKAGNQNYPTGIILPQEEQASYINGDRNAKGIINNNIYGTSDYGGGLTNDMFGLYVRPGYYINTANPVNAILKEFRHISNTTFCGAAADNYWADSRIQAGIAAFGPILTYQATDNSGNVIYKFPAIPDDLAQNTASTNINRIGSWPFQQYFYHQRWEENDVHNFTNMRNSFFNSNSQSQACLRHLLRITVTDSEKSHWCYPGESCSGDAYYRAVPANKCPGAGGSYRSNCSACGVSSGDWRMHYGTTGMAHLKCS